MIPMILMAIEDDADRAFMINLYEQCHKAMYRQAYDILRDHGEAEDAVQDTLVKLIGRMAGPAHHAPGPAAAVCRYCGQKHGDRPLAPAEKGACGCQ